MRNWQSNSQMLHGLVINSQFQNSYVYIYNLSFKYFLLDVPGNTKFTAAPFHYTPNDCSLPTLLMT